MPFVRTLLTAALAGLLACSGSQSDEVASGPDDRVDAPPPEPIPQPPPPVLGQQSSSCVVRPTDVTRAVGGRGAVIGASEILCNSPITGPSMSASTGGTRHVAFRLGETSGFEPAEVGLWTAYLGEPGRVQILPVLGGFPAVATDEQGVAHLIRVEGDRHAIAYTCDDQDPMRWRRELISHLRDEGYPTDITIGPDGAPRVVIRRTDIRIHWREPDGRWPDRSLRLSDRASSARLLIDDTGVEHVVHWIGSSGMVVHDGEDRRATGEPRLNGHGLNVLLIRTAGMSSPRAVIGFRGNISHFSYGVHVLVPVGEREHLAVVFNEVPGLPEATCPGNRQPDRAYRCQRNLVSFGYPSLVLWSDGSIWVSYVAYVRLQQMELIPGGPDRVTAAQDFVRLTLARISPDDGSWERRLTIDLPHEEGGLGWNPFIERVGDELHLAYRNTERSLIVLRIDPARTSVISTSEAEPQRYELFR